MSRLKQMKEDLVDNIVPSQGSPEPLGNKLPPKQKAKKATDVPQPPKSSGQLSGGDTTQTQGGNRLGIGGG